MAAACAGRRPPARPALPSPAGSDAPPAAERLEDAFRAVLTGAQDRDGLRLETECRTAAGYQSVVLFGSGTGIWERKREFRLSRDQLDRLLRAFERHRFFTLAEVYGGRREPRRPEQFVLTVTCVVALAIDGHAKRVMQVEPGERSPELKELAETILSATAAPGRAGREAKSLQDGLQQVARGALAAETLSLSAQHQPPIRSEEGWIVSISGRRLSSQAWRPEGYGEAREMTLGADEVSALARLLAEAAVWELPDNLMAEGYTDLTVQVLGQGKQVQARAFAGREPDVERAARLERVRDALDGLHRRAQREGRILHGAGAQE